jgi:hypothetical protein
MENLLKHAFAIALTSALGVGLMGCDKPSSDSSTNEPKSDDKIANLCTEYVSCHGCIAGQTAKGNTEGEAQTQCALAVTGCWTTWEKPVVCGDKTHEEPEPDQ